MDFVLIIDRNRSAIDHLRIQNNQVNALRWTVISLLLISLIGVMIWLPHPHVANMSEQRLNTFTNEKIVNVLQPHHSIFISDLETAKKLLASNVKFSVPCAFGVDCRLHFRPTLRERTNGRWLHENDDAYTVRLPQSQSKLTIQTSPADSADLAADQTDNLVHTRQQDSNVIQEVTDPPADEDEKETAEEKLKRAEAAVRKQISNLEEKYADTLSE